jgi:CheY-like chemotaxis protein
MLERLGYTVVVARTPGEALTVAAEHIGPIDLLITDVVMPEMNGRELAERLSAFRPGLKCLYMSGYTADIISHRGVLDEGLNFIQKPFSMRDLAEKVRETLGRQ